VQEARAHESAFTSRAVYELTSFRRKQKITEDINILSNTRIKTYRAIITCALSGREKDP